MKKSNILALVLGTSLAFSSLTATAETAGIKNQDKKVAATASSDQTTAKDKGNDKKAKDQAEKQTENKAEKKVEQKTEKQTDMKAEEKTEKQYNLALVRKARTDKKTGKTELTLKPLSADETTANQLNVIGEEYVFVLDSKLTCLKEKTAEKASETKETKTANESKTAETEAAKTANTADKGAVKETKTTEATDAASGLPVKTQEQIKVMLTVQTDASKVTDIKKGNVILIVMDKDSNPEEVRVFTTYTVFEKMDKDKGAALKKENKEKENKEKDASAKKGKTAEPQKTSEKASEKTTETEKKK